VNSLFYSKFAWGIDRKPSAGEGRGRAGISRLDWRRWHWRGRARLNDLCRVFSNAILNRIDMLSRFLHLIFLYKVGLSSPITFRSVAILIGAHTARRILNGMQVQDRDPRQPGGLPLRKVRRPPDADLARVTQALADFQRSLPPRVTLEINQL
jgi:hypothetical protein